MNEFHLAIISTKRPGNVTFMQKLCEPFECHWYVNYGEEQDYKEAGAKYIWSGGNNICYARNLAIQRATMVNLPCVQISDDLRSIRRIRLDVSGKRVIKLSNVAETVNELISQLKKHNAFFGGVAINNNPLNYTGEDVSTDKLIVNDFICMMPSLYRFDESLALKEDYDMCVFQLLEGHKIIRLNNILCDFPHRTNPGGANTYRNDATEDAATRAIMAKWPKYIIPHKTRPGQISLDYKAIERRLKGQEPTSLF
jgi:hypothetical protein